MKPASFAECNLEIAKNQPEYLTLPAHFDGTITTTAWRMSWRERLTIMLRGTLWLQVMTFGMALQPQKPTASKPDLLWPNQ